LLLAVSVFAVPALAATPSQTCQSNKNKEAGKYASCRQTADAKYAITGDTAALTTALAKCETRFDLKWPVLESKADSAGDPCPSTGDQDAIRSVIDEQTTNVATALAGGTLQDCPADLVVCQGDLTTCNEDVVNLDGELGACQNDLAACQGATTTTTSSTTTSTTLRLVDNGDGTVTDNKTGLQWEKKDNTCPGIHCVTDTYSWSSSGSAPDGGAFATFLNMLNGGATGVGNCVSSNGTTQTGGFAGHCDWRLPTVTELLTIKDCSFGSPCIDPVLGASAPAVSPYWSSTTVAGSPTQVWKIFFSTTPPSKDGKILGTVVRAVRAGS
jgi:hypothetical protein